MSEKNSFQKLSTKFYFELMFPIFWQMLLSNTFYDLAATFTPFIWMKVGLNDIWCFRLNRFKPMLTYFLSKLCTLQIDRDEVDCLTYSFCWTECSLLRLESIHMQEPLELRTSPRSRWSDQSKSLYICKTISWLWIELSITLTLNT